MKSFFQFFGMAFLALGEPLFEQSSFKHEKDSLPSGWRIWTARQETAPRVFVDEINFRGAPGSLVVSGASNAAASGGVERVADGLGAVRGR